jgi:hypothetical protein
MITNITQATNGVVTAPNHGLVSGITIILNSVGGMVQVNENAYVITVIDANNFFINTNTSSFTAYTSGGSWFSSPYNGFTTASPLIASVNNDPGTLSNPNLFFPQGRVQNILITANVIGANGVGLTQNVTDDGNGNLIQIFQTSNGGNQAYAWIYYRQYASSTPTIPGNATINYQTGQIIGLTLFLKEIRFKFNIILRSILFLLQSCFFKTNLQFAQCQMLVILSNSHAIVNLSKLF